MVTRKSTARLVEYIHKHSNRSKIIGSYYFACVELLDKWFIFNDLDAFLVDLETRIYKINKALRFRSALWLQDAASK